MSLKRRAFLKAAATAVGAAVVMPRQASDALGQTRQLVYCSTGGAWQDAARKAWLEPFSRETGLRVLDVFPFEIAKLTTMLQTRNLEWDLFDIPGSAIGAAAEKGLLEKIDWSIVSKDGLPAGSFNDYAAPYGSYSTIMIYNTRRYPDPSKAPKSWSDFWDVKRFPGPRSLRRQPHVMLEAALLADGVPIEKLYPLDVDRAFRSLDRIKPHVRVWWTSAAQSIQLVADGEVDMGVSWNGRALNAKREGAPLEIVWHQGALAQTFHGVARGTKNRDSAMRLMAYIMKPENWVRILDHYPRAIPTNTRALGFPAVEKVMPGAIERMSRQYVLDELGYWAKNYDALSERYRNWLARG